VPPPYGVVRRGASVKLRILQTEPKRAERDNADLVSPNSHAPLLSRSAGSTRCQLTVLAGWAFRRARACLDFLTGINEPSAVRAFVANDARSPAATSRAFLLFEAQGGAAAIAEA
jgi:hypothetical protein